MVTVFKLLPDPIPGMEIDSMEFQPGSRIGEVPHTSNTKEYLTCISGQLEVLVSGTKYTVNAGDILAFAGDQPHSYSDPGNTKTECVSVVVLAPHGV